jgi:hypothetical protein
MTQRIGLRLAAALTVAGTAACSVTTTGDAGPAPSAAASSTRPAKPRGPLTTIPEGTWTVGEDIKAGTYKVAAEVDEGCGWVIYRGTNPVNGGNGPGFPKATLKNRQTFESHGCGTWKRTGS